MKVRLDTTVSTGDGRFVQQWSIIDGDDVHNVVSDSEWGDVQIKSGGDRVYDIDGIPVRADQIVAVEIACLCNCTDDGDETTIDTEWVQRANESGISLTSLNGPV